MRTLPQSCVMIAARVLLENPVDSTHSGEIALLSSLPFFLLTGLMRGWSGHVYQYANRCRTVGVKMRLMHTRPAPKWDLKQSQAPLRIYKSNEEKNAYDFVHTHIHSFCCESTQSFMLLPPGPFDITLACGYRFSKAHFWPRPTQTSS